MNAAYSTNDNRKGVRILAAGGATFAFMCAVGIILLANGQKEATCATAKASLFLFAPLCYTAYKCPPACTTRAFRIAFVYSLCLCSITAITAGYMFNNTFVAKPIIIAAIVLAVPLTSIYIARLFSLFKPQPSPSLFYKDGAGHAPSTKPKHPSPRPSQTRQRFSDWRQLHPAKAFLMAWLAMFALWLPYLLAFWPCV